MGLGKGEIPGMVSLRGFVWQNGNARKEVENVTNLQLSEQVHWELSRCLQLPLEMRLERPLRSRWGENCLRD